jgi:hypothetical protein
MGHRAKAFTLAEKEAQAWARQHERRQMTQYVFFPIGLLFENKLIFLVRSHSYLYNTTLHTGGLMAGRGHLLSKMIFVCLKI